MSLLQPGVPARLPAVGLGQLGEPSPGLVGDMSRMFSAAVTC